MFQIPDLHTKWPFPKRESPWQEEALKTCADWIENFTHNLFSPSTAQKFRRMNVGYIASLAYPHHSKELLLSCCNFINMVFVVDDVTDVLDASQVRVIANICMDALR